MSDRPETIPITIGRRYSQGPQRRLRPADRRQGPGERRHGAPPSLAGVAWPLAVGLLMAPFAPLLSHFLARFGSGAIRLVLPLFLLAARPEFGFDPDTSRKLSEVVLVLQFPLDGALTVFNLRRGVRTPMAAFELIILHLAGASVLWLLAQPHLPR